MRITACFSGWRQDAASRSTSQHIVRIPKDCRRQTARMLLDQCKGLRSFRLDGPLVTDHRPHLAGVEPFTPSALFEMIARTFGGWPRRTKEEISSHYTHYVCLHRGPALNDVSLGLKRGVIGEKLPYPWRLSDQRCQRRKTGI